MKIVQYLRPEDFPLAAMEEPQKFRDAIERVTRTRLQLRDRDTVPCTFPPATIRSSPSSWTGRPSPGRRPLFLVHLLQPLPRGLSPWVRGLSFAPTPLGAGWRKGATAHGIQESSVRRGRCPAIAGFNFYRRTNPFP